MSEILFRSCGDLVDYVNQNLGEEWCNKFARTRKELAKLKRSPTQNQLFSYDPSKNNDWAINEGGHKEVQYHIFYRDDSIGYGLGFSTEYTPFYNEKSNVDYIKPFTDAFCAVRSGENINRLKSKGFSFIWGKEDDLLNIQEGQYYCFGKVITPSEDAINQMLEDIKGDMFSLYCEIFKAKNDNLWGKKMATQNIEDKMQLLRSNHNIILHGAPGTGKTYLARKIAAAMGCSDNEIGFVQFHQSYDYTDFVEGLRPAKSGDDNESVSFERIDGSFKKFCKKALGIENQHYQGFDSVYNDLLNDIRTKKLKFTTLVRSKTFGVEINANNNLYAIPDTETATKMPITKENLQSYVETGKIKDWKPYVTSIGEYLRNTYSEKLGPLKKDKPVEKKKYVFIIDEINRGEMSKIFGELFFSIDPGYRGEKGRINTQYQNLVEEGDTFENGFYVPENVYIIGTMNDIDRSVESMDFAMRRRFAFVEIKAEDRVEMLDELKYGKKEEAKARMISINTAIENVPGLSSAYHIGPAYFLKLDNYKGDFDSLWEYHIEGVVKEYLRGIDPDGTHFGALKKAYDQAAEG